MSCSVSVPVRAGEVDDEDSSVDLVDGGNIRVHEVARAASDAPQLVHEGCLARVLKADEADVALLRQDAPRRFFPVMSLTNIRDNSSF